MCGKVWEYGPSFFFIPNPSFSTASFSDSRIFFPSAVFKGGGNTPHPTPTGLRRGNYEKKAWWKLLHRGPPGGGRGGVRGEVYELFSSYEELKCLPSPSLLSLLARGSVQKSNKSSPGGAIKHFWWRWFWQWRRRWLSLSLLVIQRRRWCYL